jgi:hypothetical protein
MISKEFRSSGAIITCGPIALKWFNVFVREFMRVIALVVLVSGLTSRPIALKLLAFSVHTNDVRVKRTRIYKISVTSLKSALIGSLFSVFAIHMVL